SLLALPFGVIEAILRFHAALAGVGVESKTAVTGDRDSNPAAFTDGAYIAVEFFGSLEVNFAFPRKDFEWAAEVMDPHIARGLNRRRPSDLFHLDRAVLGFDR